MACTYPYYYDYYTGMCQYGPAAATTTAFVTFSKSQTLVYIANIIVISGIIWWLHTQDKSLFGFVGTSSDLPDVLPQLIAIYLLVFTVLSIIFKIIAEFYNSSTANDVSFYTLMVPSLIFYLIVIFIVCLLVSTR
jgi:hypothetical protein